MKTIIITAASFIGLLVLLFALNAIGLINYRAWAPRWAEARREVFEESPSPYSAQYVSPGYHLDEPDGGDLLMPQPEPNGLFVPDGLSATWILCSDGEGGVKPVYSEPELMVSPFPLQAVSSYATR